MLSLAAQGANHYRFWELRGHGFARGEANTHCDWHPKEETYTVLGCKFARANEHSGLLQLILGGGGSLVTTPTCKDFKVRLANG